MLSDQDANLVMAEIEDLTDALSEGGVTTAVCNVMLSHLYEMHRLRDEVLWRRLVMELEEDYRLWNVPYSIREMNNA